MTLLRTDKLVKAFSGRRVVDEVGFTVEPGEIVGLLGPNGAGKTTTFRMVTGILKPDSGQVFFKDENITRLPMYQRARRGIGYLPQLESIFQRLSVEDNLHAILELQKDKKANRKSIAGGLLEEYGLAHVAKQKAHTLSGGERRRLEICRALLISPSLVLLDEPFAAIDPIAVADIQGFVRKLKAQGIGVLLTDHSVRETLSITDRAYIIDTGTVLAHGTPDEVTSNPAVRKIYLGEDFRM
jgi:lipopolysaccharide export system ATP-binding protein